MKRQEKLELIKEAKAIYEKNPDSDCGMCRAFFIAWYGDVELELEYPIGYQIFLLIPEFNPDFLNATEICEEYDPWCKFWWVRVDRESRLAAFDKLISVYEDN